MLNKKKYTYNINPKFIPKKKQRKKNKFILNLIKKAKKIDIVNNEIINSILPIDPITGNLLIRFRRLNKYRAIAMKVVIQAMLYYFNTKSKKVSVSIKQLSDECGLSTISESGNKSITRTSRLISKFMEPMGFIKCKRIKNKKGKEIVLTPLFFMLFDTKKNSFNTNDSSANKNKQKLTILDKKNVYIKFF